MIPDNVYIDVINPILKEIGLQNGCLLLKDRNQWAYGRNKKIVKFDMSKFMLLIRKGNDVDINKEIYLIISKVGGKLLTRKKRIIEEIKFQKYF